MADYTPYQQKIIKRYYKNFDAIKSQRLSELATELYLAEGKKRDRLWGQVEQTLRKLEFPESRIAHLLEKRDPALLVGILKELGGGAEPVGGPVMHDLIHGVIPAAETRLRAVDRRKGIPGGPIDEPPHGPSMRVCSRDETAAASSTRTTSRACSAVTASGAPAREVLGDVAVIPVPVGADRRHPALDDLARLRPSAGGCPRAAGGSAARVDVAGAEGVLLRVDART